MGIDIIGYSNVKVRALKQPETTEEAMDDLYESPDFVHIQRPLYYYGEPENQDGVSNTTSFCASRSYSGYQAWYVNLFAIAKARGVSTNNVFFPYSGYNGVITPSENTVASETFLLEMCELLSKESEEALCTQFGFDSWDVEFTGHMRDVFIKCNQSGIIVVC